MNKFRIDLTRLNNLLNLSNDVFGCCCHVCIEVSGSFIEIQVSESISLLSLYKCDISENGLFFDVLFAIENFDVFGCWVNFNISLAILELSWIFDGESTLLNLGSNPCGCVKSWDTGTSRSDFFCKGSLRGDFKLKFSFQILSFELSIFPNIRWNHSFDLMISEEDGETPIVNWIFISVSTVVRNNSQVFESKLFDSIDEVHGDTTNTETSNQNFWSVLDSLEGLMNRWSNFVDFGEKIEVTSNICYKHFFVRCIKFMW